MKVFEERGISSLDLHGVKHEDAAKEILNFVFQYQDLLPLIVICGNSNRMLEIAGKALDSSGVSFSSPRFGILRIEGLS